MIRKLKGKFTLLATASLLLFMALLVAVMNAINYSSVVAESDTVLEVLAQPNGPFSEGGNQPAALQDPPDKKGEDGFVPRGMSPEVPYESRFFSVTVNASGEITDADFSRILSVDGTSVKSYIESALAGGEHGFIGQFRYCKMKEGQATRLLFLDCGRKLDAFYNFLWTSLCVGLFGCVLMGGVFFFVSGKIVKPIAESYEKQKRFISDAGHEIKTPLTIIAANVDLLASEGESEELAEIRLQTKRLSSLTKDLVYLSKMEERREEEKIECPLSDIVSETAASFRAPLAAKGISFSSEITEGVSVKGAPDALRQLVSVLLDNAQKYTPAGKEIRLSLTKQKKSVTLSLQNDVETPLSQEDLPNLFSRFFRTDASRNSATGGHGIGLSIAKAVTDAHGGSIAATAPSRTSFCITVTLPL